MCPLMCSYQEEARSGELPDMVHGVLWGLCKQETVVMDTEKLVVSILQSPQCLDGEPVGRWRRGIRASPKDGDAINCNLETSSDSLDLAEPSV